MSGFWNNMKTVILLGALMGLCLGIGYLIGGRGALIPAFIVGGAMNFIAFFFSDRIALATMRAKEVGPEDDPELYRSVEDLSRLANMPMPRVYVSPASAPNAFATGRSPSHSAVCVTAGLRQMLNRDELRGVLAHELSHIKHRDVLISTVAATIAGAISMLTYLAFWFGGRDRDRGNPLVALLLMILAPLAAAIIQMAISRSREFEADREGAELAQSPRGLASALQKLAYGSAHIPLHVTDAQGSLFIVAPLTHRGRDMGLAKLFQTHPPVEERVERLMAMEPR